VLGIGLATEGGTGEEGEGEEKERSARSQDRSAVGMVEPGAPTSAPGSTRTGRNRFPCGRGEVGRIHGGVLLL
jgi:hypothetical protein